MKKELNRTWNTHRVLVNGTVRCSATIRAFKRLYVYAYCTNNTIITNGILLDV